MQLTFLGPLYARQGPFACVYVDTSQDIEDAKRAIELRWRHLQRELEARGADEATTGAVAPVVGTDRDVPGPHGQAVFAAHGQLLLAEELPEPPARDSARFSLLPDALPLAVQHAPDIAYAAVEMRRVRQPEREVLQQDLEVEVEAGHWPTARVGGGARSVRRLPVGEWQQRGAAQVAGELTALADQGSAEVIVLCGDMWARGVLLHEVPTRLRERTISRESHGPVAVPGRALLEAELIDLFRGRLSVRDRARVEMFLARRARDGDASVVAGDVAVDDLRRRVDDLAYTTIARQAPVAPICGFCSPRCWTISTASGRNVESSWGGRGTCVGIQRESSPAPMWQPVGQMRPSGGCRRLDSSDGTAKRDGCRVAAGVCGPYLDHRR